MIHKGNQKILIIAPHADDEVLGCGGLIEKACRLNNTVKVLISTVGNTKFRHSNMIVTPETRKLELINAMQYLQCTDVEVLYDDKEAFLDTIPQMELVNRLDHIIQKFNPTMVFIPYPSFHQDHQALFNACMASLRPSPHLNIKLVAMFEYPFIVWQYPKINDTGELYLDISETIDKKIEAFKMHKSQIRDSQSLISPESIKSWAEKRGMEIGVPYAEKYHLLRALF